MSQYLEQRIKLIKEMNQAGIDYQKYVKETRKKLGELLNLHNKETADNERKLVEDQNKLDEADGLLQGVREKQGRRT